MDFHVSVDLNGAIHTMLDRIKETVSDGRMENCYVPNNPNYQDLWRSSPLVKQDSSLARPQELTPGPRGSLEYGRSSMDLGVNPYGPMSPTEMDPLSNIFSFSSPGYKEFSVFKEKKPAEIADALLSLKHAVVHPGQVTGQLTPLSPGLPPMSSQGGHSALSAGGMGPAPSFSYSVNPHGHHAHAQPGGAGGYAGMSGAGQYAASPAQYADLSAAGHAQSVAAQNQMFPSMSVNVSMSMNVGVPPNNGFHGGGNGSGNALSGEHAQWSPGPHHPAGSHSPHAPSHHYPAHNEIHMQAQYPGYATSAQAYNASYSFGSELRSPTGFANKEMMYHRSTSESYRSAVPKFYSALNNFSLRRKPPTGRVNGAEHGKVNLCRICGKTYARPSTLKTHMRTHSGEKPYKCQTCNKSFSQAANLTAHVRTHSGEKPFRCHICDRRFSQSSSVTTHMRTHSGERPYRCRMCKKAFSDSSTLTKHLRIHSGEKPYQCKLCLLRFSQSGNLNRHMRVHSSNN